MPYRIVTINSESKLENNLAIHRNSHLKHQRHKKAWMHKIEEDKNRLIVGSVMEEKHT